MDSFSANQTCVIFSCILLHADREWNFRSSYRRIHTDPANSNRKDNWEVCKHAKRRKAKKALDYVSCSPTFLLSSSYLLLLYNKTKLLSFICERLSFDIKRGRFTLEIIVIWNICCSRPNRGQFSLFHILSALFCSFEKWNTSDDEVKNISLLFLIYDWSILFGNQWLATNSVRLTEHSMRINVCSLECDLTKHYPWS